MVHIPDPHAIGIFTVERHDNDEKQKMAKILYVQEVLYIFSS